MADRPLDVICIGRSSVDLYGEQVGGRLEDMASFSKYVGGCPTNISVGTARLGLRSALFTRVGDEHMGRFIREQLVAEGVDVSHVITDPQRLTALVILGIRDDETFPLIFFRENCADMAIAPEDIGSEFVASAQAVLVSGTHFSTPQVDSASRHAIKLAKQAGTKVVFDVDYRPVLWGLTGHGLGEERFVASASVSEHLQSIVPDCDLIVGTEEELHIAGGTTNTLAAIRRVRELSDAVIVCKRGPMGCVVFPGEIPDDLENGIKGPGFPVEVYNVLGAGDAFMSGFLRGWLRDAPLEDCCKYANACGAFAVSRHGCAPAVPSWTELSYFLEHGSPHHALRHDRTIEQIHWSTNRNQDWSEVCALAFDHRSQFEALAASHGAGADRIERFKELVWQAARKGSGGAPGFGVIVDDRYGRDVLYRATGSGIWIGRPIERPGTVPLEFEGGADVAVTLNEWPVEHVVKCLVFYHPDDADDLKAKQERRVVTLQEACRATSHELLLEVIASKSGPVGTDTVASVLQRFYDLGVAPDWWKLESPADRDAWSALAGTIAKNDPHCRGILLLGLDAPEDELRDSFAVAAEQPLCRGFAIGRSIFGEPARRWFAGEIADEEAVEQMAATYARLLSFWRDTRQAAA